MNGGCRHDAGNHGLPKTGKMLPCCNDKNYFLHDVFAVSVCSGPRGVINCVQKFVLKRTIVLNKSWKNVTQL